VCVCVCVFFYPGGDLNLNAHRLMGNLETSLYIIQNVFLLCESFV